jgi:hypothetical protein
MTSSDEDESDDSSTEDEVDTKSDGKKGHELTPAIVLEKDNNAGITSKRKSPKTTKKVTDKNPNIKKRKVNKEKSAKLPVDFHVKPATSIVSTKADVMVDRRFDLFEKRVRCTLATFSEN